MQYCFIDRVTKFVAGESAAAYKNITVNHEILGAHFPGYVLFPGTQIIEAMAQLSGFLIELSLDKTARGNRRAVLVKIEKAKFHQAVIPGDRLELVAQLLSEFNHAYEVKVTASVDTATVAQAQLTFVLKAVDIPEVHERQDRLYRLWLSNLNPELTQR